MEAFGSAIRRVAILVLAVGLTFASVRYVRPTPCLDFCTQSDGLSCPCGFCHEAQRAGFPFSFLHDQASSSPISGWGRAGYEDLIPTIFVLDVAFYSVLLALVWLVPSSLPAAHARAHGVGGDRGRCVQRRFRWRYDGIDELVRR